MRIGRSIMSWQNRNPDGTYGLEGSTVVIQNGRIMGGTGPHWDYCRYTGQFQNGKATVFGGPGSKWAHSFTQQWVIRGDSIIVEGGQHTWTKMLACDGTYTFEGCTVQITNGRIVSGTGKHWDHCRYTGEFINGKATIFGGPGSKWSHTLTQQWVQHPDGNMYVDGGKTVIWRKL